MGTQFHSRLSDRDREQISERIREVLRKAKKASTTPAATVTGRGEATKQGSGVRLAKGDAAALGNGLLHTVLDVAEHHQFTNTLSSSLLFPEVLQWLLRIRGDAEFNGFQGVIAEYDLDSRASPIAELSKQLADVIRDNNQGSDPFRVAVSNAAKAVLAQAVVGRGSERATGTVAAELGRGLARMELRTLVTHFISSFFSEFVRSLIRHPDVSADARAERAVDLTDKSIRQLAARTVKRVTAAGAFTDGARIHGFVVEELKRFMAQRLPLPAA